MPKMFVVSSVAIARDGKRILPPIGTVFNFSKDEIDAITKLAPRAIRPPVNESGANDVESTEDDGTDKTKANPGDPMSKTTPKASTESDKTAAAKTAAAKTPDTKGL